jgi:hypothetical protein
MNHDHELETNLIESQESFFSLKTSEESKPASFMATE